MEPQIPPTESLSGEKRKGRKKRVIMALILFAHIDFYFSQSLYLPLTVEQLFTFGEILLLTDVGLLVIFGVKLLRKKTDA